MSSRVPTFPQNKCWDGSQVPVQRCDNVLPLTGPRSDCLSWGLWWWERVGIDVVCPSQGRISSVDEQTMHQFGKACRKRDSEFAAFPFRLP
jgi:hypothetical protein